MESAISLFKKLPETKDQVAHYFQLIRESVLNGEVNPLDFMIQVTALEKLFSQIKTDALLKDCVLEEAEKYSAKMFEHNNAVLSIREVGTRYDFEPCMDVEWETLSAQADRLKTRLKEREAFLKTLKPDMEVYGADGVQISPPVKTSTTSVVITLK